MPSAVGATTAVSVTPCRETTAVAEDDRVVREPRRTVTVVGAEVLPAKMPAPPNVAVIAWLPVPSVLVKSRAWPCGSSTAASRNVLPSLKVTDPDGVAEPIAGVTVARRVIKSPTTANVSEASSRQGRGNAGGTDRLRHRRRLAEVVRIALIDRRDRMSADGQVRRQHGCPAVRERCRPRTGRPIGEYDHARRGGHASSRWPKGCGKRHALARSGCRSS